MLALLAKHIMILLVEKSNTPLGAKELRTMILWVTKIAQAMYKVAILDKVNDHEVKMEWFHISLSCFEYEFEWRVQYNGTSLSYFVITVRKKLIKGNHSQISDFKKSDKSV